MTKIIFLKGLPASGKSTWANQYILDNPNTFRVNKDDIRNLLHNGVYSKANEMEVIDYQFNLVATWLAEGKTVIIDNTHLAWTHEEDYRELANDFDAEFEIKSFLDVSVDTCLERNSKRIWKERVPDKVILSMGRSVGMYPEWEKEFDKVLQSPLLPPAIIVDIDWTIAKMEGRSPYDYSKVGTDSVHWDVVKLIEYYTEWFFHEMGQSIKIILCSGRPDSCRNATEAWLEANKIDYDELHMRASDDKRKDCQVKYEILLDLIKKFNILASFDDRMQVVTMWREAWLRCFQVANWNF